MPGPPSDELCYPVLIFRGLSLSFPICDRRAVPSFPALASAGGGCRPAPAGLEDVSAPRAFWRVGAALSLVCDSTQPFPGRWQGQGQQVLCHVPLSSLGAQTHTWEKKTSWKIPEVTVPF